MQCTSALAPTAPSPLLCFWTVLAPEPLAASILRLCIFLTMLFSLRKPSKRMRPRTQATTFQASWPWVYDVAKPDHIVELCGRDFHYSPYVLLTSVGKFVGRIRAGVDTGYTRGSTKGSAAGAASVYNLRLPTEGLRQGNVRVAGARIYQATACSRRPPRDRTLALALL